MFLYLHIYVYIYTDRKRCVQIHFPSVFQQYPEPSPAVWAVLVYTPMDCDCILWWNVVLLVKINLQSLKVQDYRTGKANPS